MVSELTVGSYVLSVISKLFLFLLSNDVFDRKHLQLNAELYMFIKTININSRIVVVILR